MASVTDVTIGATSTSILTAAIWKTLGGPVYLKNESDTIVVLTISSADAYNLDPGEVLQVLPGQVITGTAVGGSKLLQIIAGIVPSDESAAKAAGGSSSGGASGGGRALWSTGQDDFTAVRLAATTLTLGTFPAAMGTVTAPNFVQVVVTDSAGEQTTYTPDSNAMTIAGQVLTVADAVFDATDLGYDVFIWGPPKSYAASEGADQVANITPEWAHVLTQQESATGLGDGVSDEYIDLEYYNEVTIQITDTPGTAGTNTYKFFASAQNDGTAEASVEEVDVGSKLFSAATFTTDAFEPCSQPFRAKYLHIEITRTADGANTDGGYQLDIMAGNA